MNSRHSLSREGLFLLFVVALGWGLSWTVVKHSIGEIPPLSFRGVSALIGGVCLLALARQGGVSLRIPPKALGQVLILAFFNIAAWNVLSTYGVLYLPSGRAALLAYTMPLWCVPLSMGWLGEPLTRQRLLALLLGCGGVAVLIGGDAQALAQAPLGVALMIAAAFCWACGVVLFKRWIVPMPTLALTGWLLVLGALPLVVAASLVDGLPAQMPSPGALAGLAFSALVTFMLCNWMWNRLVLLVPVAVSSLSSLITPLVGVASGALFLGERPGWREAVAALLILGAVGVINYGRRNPHTG